MVSRKLSPLTDTAVNTLSSMQIASRGSTTVNGSGVVTNAGVEFFHGAIDEVAVYNVALDPGTIRWHHLVGTGTWADLTGDGTVNFDDHAELADGWDGNMLTYKTLAEQWLEKVLVWP